jgi:hypothetical protein
MASSLLARSVIINVPLFRDDLRLLPAPTRTRALLWNEQELYEFPPARGQVPPG